MAFLSRKIALSIFGVIIISAPLVFGAVDRSYQVALTALLGFGLLAVEPLFPRFDKIAGRTLLLLAAILIVSQFAPHFLFRKPEWRSLLGGDFGLSFPFTHHPEPARALDALLTIFIAAVWFFWVQKLGDDRDQRLLLAWMLFTSSALLAIVCLVLGTSSTGLIYGFRPTLCWSGYGPFPNRNHTACFLAMGVPVGIGCVVTAARRKRFIPLAIGHVFLGLIVVALLESRSRGGLTALAVGLCFYLALALIQSRTRKMLVLILACAFLASAMFLAFGSKVMGRFNADGATSTQTRKEIWQDAIGLWKEAPLLGHGLGTFTGIFPVYQTVRLDNQVVLHPESSWVQWLTELGFIPVAIASIALLIFLIKNLAEMLPRKNGFFLRVGGLSAVAVLLSHSIWDVPAHRWATAAFGLAALALVSPFRSDELRTGADRRLGFAVLGVAFFWLLPFITGFPAWSPTTTELLLARETKTPGQVPLSDLERALRFFPLESDLHQAIGMRQLPSPDSQDSAWQHFSVANRLQPSCWSLPANQAAATRRFSAGMSLHFWTVAIERAGPRGDEIFQMAYKDTSDLPVAGSFWGGYVETKPSMLLPYAKCVPDDEAVRCYSLWWQTRALTGPLQQFEVDAFYNNASRWGKRGDLDAWMKRYPEWEARDYREWATLLHGWKDDALAWRIISRWVREPEVVKRRVSTSTPLLEMQWAKDPKDFLNAQALAEDCILEGKKEKSDKVILSVAEKEHPPRWFLRKAAYIHAERGDYTSAVNAMLRGT